MTKTLLGLKTARKSKCINDRQSSDRHRDCLVLILSFLRQYGYIQSAAQLQSEGGTILLRYEPADNIDLIQILTEYEDFCEIKFKRKPKLSRAIQNLKCDHRGNDELSSMQFNDIRNSTTVPKVHRLLPKRQQYLPTTAKGSSKMNQANSENSAVNDRVDESCGKQQMMIHVQGLESGKSSQYNNKFQNTQTKENNVQRQSLEERVIKPLPSFGDNHELRALASTIQDEIVDRSPGVSWSDIVALEDAKRLLKEAVILPIQYPDLFSGLLVPWRGILLYGPPGTGKTLLAKAVATESQTTFFNISASSIVSKFRGESEKLIKALFELARYHSPSTVFIDEIDSIMGQRGLCGSSGGESGSEHEGSRRMKTELLIEMDGLGKQSEHVFVLAASNMPWDLDPALLRRLEKRIVVPMPNEIARKMLLKTYLSFHHSQLEDKDYDEYASKTEGYNCADIKVLCKEAAMSKVRGIFKKLETMNDTDEKSGSRKSNDVQAMLKRDPITSMDLEKSLQSTKPSTDPKMLKKYDEWAESHGAM